MGILEALDASRAETLRYFELESGELEATYGPGKWSVRFVLHHLADSEAVCCGGAVLQDAYPRRS